MDEPVLQNSGTVPIMAPADLNATAPDDLLYLIQGRGIDRDRQLEVKDVGKVTLKHCALTEAQPNEGNSTWNGWVLGAANNGPFPAQPYKLPFREIALGGIHAMPEDMNAPSANDFVPVSGPTSTRKVPIKFLSGGVKVIYFGVNPNRPSEVQTYAIQPEDRELIVYCESKPSAEPPTITGVAPLGLIVRFSGGTAWGDSTDTLGRIVGGVRLPDMDDLVYPVFQGYTSSVMFLGNDEYGWLRDLGSTPNLGSWSSPELFLSKLRKLIEIIVGGQTFTETFPSVSGVQKRLIKFFASVYNNILHIEKGGVRVDHGYEMARRTAAPPTIEDREVSRVYHGNNDELIWQRGQDELGNNLGNVVLSHTVENSWFAHAWDALNVADGAIWCIPIIAQSSGAGYTNIAPQMSESWGARVAIFAVLANTPAAGTSMVIRVYLQQYYADGGTAAPVPCDITLTADGSSGHIGGAAHTTGNMVIHAGAGIKISQVTVLSNPDEIDTSAFGVTFGVQTFRAAT